MARTKQDRIGAIFTAFLVLAVYIIIQINSTTLPDSDKIILILIHLVIVSIIGVYSYRKKPAKRSSDISNRAYILLFIFGVFLGVSTMSAIEATRGTNYPVVDVVSFLIWFYLSFIGYSGLYYFTAMAMVVSIIHIPIIKRKLSGSSRWVPVVEGGTLGLGVMIFLQLYWHGLPKS